MPNLDNLVRSERKAIVHSIVSPYLTSKKDRSILGQYERVSPGPDGRNRTVLSPVVTETGRLASGESFVDPNSTNWQNISKTEGYRDDLYRVRDVVIPDEGMVLLASDLDKAEAIVAAFESQDWDFYRKLIAGEDTHTWIASLAFHDGNTKAVTKHERQGSKNTYYASLYMAGVPTITRTINKYSDQLGFKITEAEVEVIRDTIMEVTRLEEWWSECWDDLMNPNTHGGTRWLENCLQFRRKFYNPDHHKLHKEAVNFFPQSTVASKIDEVLISWWNELETPGEAEILLQIHDELLVQVREDRLEHYASALHSLMEQSFTSHGQEVHIPAGLEAGYRWEAFRGSDNEPNDPDNSLRRMEGFRLDE